VELRSPELRRKRPVRSVGLVKGLSSPLLCAPAWRPAHLLGYLASPRLDCPGTFSAPAWHLLGICLASAWHLLRGTTGSLATWPCLCTPAVCTGGAGAAPARGTSYWVAEEEARLNELRARSRAGKERQVRISERALQEWQMTMDGRKIPIPQTKKRRRKQLRKHNGLASGKGCVVSYFSVVPPSSPGSSPHPPCAGVTRYVGRSCSCIGGPGSSRCKGGCDSMLRTGAAHLSSD
jgi:hypothetical protein